MNSMLSVASRICFWVEQANNEMLSFQIQTFSRSVDYNQASETAYNIGVGELVVDVDENNLEIQISELWEEKTTRKSTLNRH